MKETVKKIDTAIDSTSLTIEVYGADSAYQNFDTAFPVYAGLGCSLYVNIDFEDGFISMPFEGSDANCSSTFSELYKNSTKIHLGRVVTEQKYRNLLDKIVLLVTQISNGYNFQGADRMAYFTTEAENALEELYMLNVEDEDEDEDEDINIWDVEDIYDYYANGSEFARKESGEVAFIQNGWVLLMSNSSDVELESTAKTEIENMDDEINLYDLISCLQDMRSLCIEHKDDHCDSP
jgi:hypothetical protein